MSPFAKHKGRSLGIQKNQRQYDLPLNKDSGVLFLKTLVALMSLLAILALAGSFALSEMTNRWSSGLENKASIEIPVEDSQGVILSNEQMQRVTDTTQEFLSKHPAVEQYDVMSEEKIMELVAPWLGDSPTMQSIPLPKIISVSFKPKGNVDMEQFKLQLQNIAPQARIDTHESWLADILRFTGALKYTAVLITMIIGFTTIIAVAGAVKSRMAIYNEELELLHLMGAEDQYISKQLQRHTLILSFQGAVVGTIIGIIILLIINWGAGRMDITLIPDFSLNFVQKAVIFLIPAIVAGISMVTARQTVLRNLAKMP